MGPLPLLENWHGGFDMICMIIDQLMSIVHLVLIKQTYDVVEIMEVIFKHVYKLHSISEHIISDHDTLFTSIF